MTTGGSSSAALPRFAAVPVAVIVLAQAAVLTALSGRYGFHRDELYFLAAGHRPAWGYADQPPITPMLARISTAVFGETPMGLRVASTVIGVAVVLLVAAMARELGGGRGAQILAAASTALSSFVLVVSHMLSTTSVDLLVWSALCLLALRLLRTGDGRWWVAIGAVVGIGMANKWLVLMLVAALGVALLAVGPRRVFRSGWLAAGVVLAAGSTVPVVLWQAAHDWPMLTVASGISAADGTENRIMLVPHQIVLLSPILVPVWIAGMVRLWRDPALRWARSVALAYPVLCVAILVTGGKPYYAIPLLLVLTAAGAEPTVRWLRSGGAPRRILSGAGAVLATAASVLIALPVLPSNGIPGFLLAVNKEGGEQVGWPHFADTVAEAWHQVPAADRATTAIFTANYGQAGALELYGPARGLPPVYSGHMSFADWGPPPDTMTGPVLLVGGGDPPESIGDCRLVTHNESEVDNDENGTPVRLCTRISGPWSQIWPTLRHFY